LEKWDKKEAVLKLVLIFVILEKISYYGVEVVGSQNVQKIDDHSQNNVDEKLIAKTILVLRNTSK